jgi:hypothetical protein
VRFLFMGVVLCYTGFGEKCGAYKLNSGELKCIVVVLESTFRVGLL